ncbi:DUF6056 family protein [Carnobacterium maltaromaticum]|uniref:DUF6056 family protein n=1 Tax=Carnobacterium maltaromaticum TaxID=2751 RepID=UPI0039BE7202
MKLTHSKNKERIIVLLSIYISFLLFNFFMTTFKADDLVYLQRVSEMGYIQASIKNYNNWSSRMVIEFFLMFLTKHFVLWKVLNATVMLGTVVIICKYVFKEIESRKLIMTFAVYSFIPLTVMGETGWIATTMNYHWPLLFAMVAFYSFYQLLINERINLTIYYLSLPLLIFAVNQEQVNACFFVLTTLLSFYLWSQRKYDYKLSLISAISFLGIVFSVTAPGNKIRAGREIIDWFPNYDNLNVINKLDLGISSFGKPFFFDFNILFILFFLLIFVLSYTKTKNYYLRLISAVPLFFNVMIYFGNTTKQGFLNILGGDRAMIWNSGNLDTLFSVNGTGLSVFHVGTWVATLSILGLLTCLIIGIYLSFNNRNKAIFVILLLLMAFCSRIIMGFSPTVWASGMRTYYISYVVVAILVLLLLKELANILGYKKMELVQFSISAIGICTFILSILTKI